MDPPETAAASPMKQISSRFSPLYQMVLSRNNISTPDSLLHATKLRSREQVILRDPRRTKPIVWFAAILCMLFTLLVIFFGVAVLIVFVAVQPKAPVFDTPAASLTAVYFTSPQLIGNDMTFLANFSNPNRKLSVRFDRLRFDLYFLERLVAAQEVHPFRLGPGEVRLVSVHLVSSLVYAPPTMAMELQKQGQRNRVVYSMKGDFRVRVNLGGVHYSYGLQGDCQLEMTSPPNGVLIAHTCRTKR